MSDQADDQVVQEEGNEENAAFEKEAKDMGWVSQDDFDGPEGKWVDAKTFIERGEHIMPILRNNNKRLKNDLLTRDKEIATLKESVESANKAIKALQKHHTAATEQAVTQAKNELRAQLKQAREIGDVDAEFEIQDKLEDLKETSKEVKEEEVEDKKPTDTQTLNPEFVAWNKENSWYGDMTNPENRKRTRALVRIGEDLREDGDTTVGRPFMDKAMEILEKQEGKKVGTKTSSKVESGGGNARGGSGGRAFDGLPSEAKNACHEDNDTFVGPGKMYKTVKDWEDAYAKTYSED